MPEPIQVATRKSPLALKQTEIALAWLDSKLPDDTFETLELSTKVDERLSWSLEKRGGIGLFTKELEEALVDGRAELAIHSAKDMPTLVSKRFTHRRATCHGQKRTMCSSSETSA